MNNNLKTHNDEIDLKELFSTIMHGKFFILFCSCLFVFCASVYLHFSERKYTVVYKLKSVGEAQQKSALSGLGGFASIAGIQLPSNATSDFDIFIEILTSKEASKIILKNKVLIQKIYSSEWDPSSERFSKPLKTKTMVYLSNLKKILTGNSEMNYNPPNAKRLAEYISENIQISKDKITGFLTLKAETSKPDMFLSLIVEMAEASDKIMRQRYINFSKEPLTFYKEKLRISRSREHREVLAELISKEEQKLMFASVGKYFTAEPYIDPKISFYPTAPKPKLILLISIIFGFFSGCGIVVLWNAYTKDK